MTCNNRCGCCKGACCYTSGGSPVCELKTCAECDALDGEWQGSGVQCDDGSCPCDPSPDTSVCEKCIDGVATYRCSASQCCVDSACDDCPEPYCPDTACPTGECCVNGQCMECPPEECPSTPCSGSECCVDGLCGSCPDYTCDPPCGAGLCCVDGNCVTCVACTPGSCGSGCCVDGFCQECPGTECTDGNDCFSDECCVDGRCVTCPPTTCPDAPCSASDCCVDGYCVNPCPSGEYCCDGDCQSTPCDGAGACCWDDGGTWVCTSEAQEVCEDVRNGTWQGAGTDCGDIDCGEGCCEFVETSGGCFVNQCTRGYNAATCATQCDPDTETIDETVADCQDGQPARVKVTGAGVTIDTGRPATDAEDDALQAEINGEYELDLTCAGNATQRFTGATYYVDVTVNMSSSRSASIGVYSVASNVLLASMTLSASLESGTVTACGQAVYPCSDFSGGVTSSGGAAGGDYTGATIDVQGV